MNRLGLLFVANVLFIPVLLSSATGQTPDCNSNGVVDSTDLSSTGLTVAAMGGVTTEGTVATGTLADVNLDGKKDLIVVTQVSGAASASYARQEADVFTLDASYSLPITPTGIALGDFDNNLFIDIGFATASSQANAFNSGVDGFNVLGSQTLTGIQPITFAGGAAAQQDADLNNDGRIDRVLVNGLNAEVYLRSEADTLVLSSSVPLTFSFCATLLPAQTVVILPVRDLDGDSDPEVTIVANQTCATQLGDSNEARLVVLENSGTGAFTTRSTTSSSLLTFLEYNDVNADGTQDLLFSSVGSSASSAPISQPRFTFRGMIVFQIARTTTSKDRNGNLVPDECDRAVPGDFGGDRRSDFAVTRSVGANVQWLVRHSTEHSISDPTITNFGLSQFDVPYAGDFDGNGTVEPAVVRDAGAVIPGLYGLYWFNQLPDQTAEAIQWGLPGDTPIIGHFDPDNKVDRAVVRGALGQLYWFIRRSTGSELIALPWGFSTDTAWSGDRNGDGVDELIVSRDAFGGIYWFTRNLDGSITEQRQWGLSGDRPLPPMDYDGDGLADLAVSRVNGRLLNFFILKSSGGFQALSFGLAADIPYLGFFGGEGQAEPAVFRPAPNVFRAEARHYQLTTSNLIRYRGWGLFGDSVIPAEGKRLLQ